VSEPITVAAFSDMAEAEKTVGKLIDGGVSAEKLSVLAKDMQCEKQVHGFVTSCDVAKKTATGNCDHTRGQLRLLLPRQGSCDFWTK
jgi:hypothetical protein